MGGRNETDEDDDEYDVHSDPEDLSIQTESSESSSDSDPRFYTWNSESSGSEEEGFVRVVLDVSTSCVDPRVSRSVGRCI